MNSPRSHALDQVFWLFDYDGSLCPHREAWEHGEFDPLLLCQTLDALRAASCGVVWNTGRTVESLGGQCSSFLMIPGFFEHGSVFWDQQKKHSLSETHLNSSLISKVSQWLESRKSWLRLEQKTHSLRIIPIDSANRLRLELEIQGDALLQSFLSSEPVYLSFGWRAVEIVSCGVNKSVAIDFLKKSSSDFAKSLPIAVGDDVGDKEVMRRVLELGGLVFLVGLHCGWISELPHKASQVYFFSTPQELISSLQQITRTGRIQKTKIPQAL